jgi:hypothetical protein
MNLICALRMANHSGTSLSKTRVRRFRRNEPRYPGEKPPYLSPQATKLVHALELDGLKVSEGVLRRALPIDIGLPAVQSEIDRLLEKHGFFVPKRQA